MGAPIILNDTLALTYSQGFPNVQYEDYSQNPQEIVNKLLGKEFSFQKDGIRIYPPGNVPAFLVQSINDKWIYWGRAIVTAQTIQNKSTKGIFKITKLFSAEFSRKLTVEMCRPGWSYFEDKPDHFSIN